MRKFLILALGVLLVFGSCGNVSAHEHGMGLIFADEAARKEVRPLTPTTESVKCDLSDLTKGSIEELLKIKTSMDTVLQLQKDGVIDAKTSQSRLEVYLKQATQVAGQNVTLEVLANQDAALRASLETKSMTVLQRAAGFITAWNIMLVFGAILIACAITLLITLLAPIFLLFPREFYELLAYAASGILMAAPLWCTSGLGQYYALTGALLLAGAFGVTISRPGWLELVGPVKSSGFLFVVWSIVAYTTVNPFIGFLAVAAFMSMIGFSVWIFPFCYCIGFKDEESVGRGTFAALVVLTAFVYMKITGVTNPGIKAFEEGALFLGSFVGYLGLLISSSEWYRRNDPGQYFVAQVVTLIAGGLAIFVGSTFGIGELLKIGGTFFVLWAIEKFLEILPEDRWTLAWVSLIVGGLIFYLGGLIKAHAALVAPFLLFM